MANKMKPATFIMTQPQLDWLHEEAERTGLKKVEIVRRALDEYRDVQAEKEERQYFTPQQKQNIEIMARMQNISETEVIRKAVDRETRVVSQRRKRRS